MKLMVLDGNSIVNRAYYGVRPLTTRDGFFTHAIFGFLTMPRAFLMKKSPRRSASPLTAASRPSVTWNTRATRPRATPCPKSLPCRCPYSKRCSTR